MKRTLHFVSLGLALLLAFLIVDFVRHQGAQDRAARQQGQDTTASLRADIDEVLQAVMAAGHDLAKQLEVNEYSEADLLELVKERSKAMDSILGVTVAFEPFAFEPDRKLFAPYFDKNKDEIIRVEEVYDYTDRKLETAQWYGRILDDGAQWVEPYYAQGAQALVADYGIPFFDSSGKAQGMVSMTISLKGFTELIHSLSLGRTGFGFVTSAQGAVLAHPIDEYIGHKNLGELREADLRQEVQTAYGAMLAGESGQVEFFDANKKQDTLFFYDKVPAASWGIGVMFFQADLLGPDLAKKRKYMHMSMVGS